MKTKLSILKEVIMVIMPIFFAFFSATMGIIYNSLWHISISIYYAFLSLCRTFIIIFGNKTKYKNPNAIKTIYVLSFIFLMIMNITFITPSVILISDLKKVIIGEIGSIAIAAYTTYSIIIGIYNVVKNKNNENILRNQLNLINLINSLMSILVLQNTLIVVNGGFNDELFALTIISTLILFMLMNILSILSFRKNIKIVNKSLKA